MKSNQNVFLIMYVLIIIHTALKNKLSSANSSWPAQAGHTAQADGMRRPCAKPVGCCWPSWAAPMLPSSFWPLVSDMPARLAFLRALSLQISKQMQAINKKILKNKTTFAKHRSQHSTMWALQEALWSHLSFTAFAPSFLQCARQSVHSRVRAVANGGGVLPDWTGTNFSIFHSAWSCLKPMYPIALCWADPALLFPWLQKLYLMLVKAILIQSRVGFQAPFGDLLENHNRW